MKVLFTLLTLLVSASAQAKNLHLIESKADTGFAIFRMGAPDKGDMAELCSLGVEEIMVMSGDAEKHEFKHQAACPTLRVVYNVDQDAKVPLTRSFLESFDQWVTEAQRTGKKIAFRCSCGCHRTGRLAAYYQLKYQNLAVTDALILMDEHGKYMFLHKQLKPQVLALRDYIFGNGCSVQKKHCVIED